MIKDHRYACMFTHKLSFFFLFSVAWMGKVFMLCQATRKRKKDSLTFPFLFSFSFIGSYKFLLFYVFCDGADKEKKRRERKSGITAWA